MNKTLQHQKIIKQVSLWVEKLVVGLNLCPFAKRELVKNRIRFSVTEANSEKSLLIVLQTELELLKSNTSIKTTLLIHPNVLQYFDDYNQFLSDADGLLNQMNLDGIFQIASFHPDYQFAGTAINDVENYTNRSPYPLLHLLREDSLEQAIADFPNPDLIPERNIEQLESLGLSNVQALFNTCIHGEKNE